MCLVLELMPGIDKLRLFPALSSGVGFTMPSRYILMRFVPRSWKQARAIVMGIALSALMVMFVLIVSGKLEPRGSVTGSVYLHGSKSGDRPFSDGKLIFIQNGSDKVFHAATDATAHFSVTLPAGTYRVLRDLNPQPDCLVPVPHQCLGPPTVTVKSGQAVSADFGFWSLDP